MPDNINTLYLLVGSNPLPVYVVSRFLIEKNNSLNKILLIHTHETREHACKLKKLLKNYHKNVEMKTLSSSSDVFNLKKDFSNLFQGQHDEDNILHLDITGGTKLMSALSLVSLNPKNQNKRSYSYLSASDFELKCFIQGEAHRHSLRNKVVLDLNDIVELHGFELISPKDQISEDKISKVCEVYNQIFENCNIKEELIEKKDDITKYLTDKIQKHNIMENIQALSDELQDKIISIYNLLQSEEKNKSSDFIKDKWLEHYTKHNIRELIESSNLYKHCKVYINVEAIRSGNEKIKGLDNDLEIDAVLLIGYQLIVISCSTTKDSRKLRDKGFEAIQRAKQIGGDASRAVIVSFLPTNPNNPNEYTKDKMQKNLRGTNFHGVKIDVLGRDDLAPKQLKSFFKKIIENND